MEEETKLIRLVESFYRSVKGSVFFWLELLRHFIVYGIVPADYYLLRYMLVDMKEKDISFQTMKKRKPLLSNYAPVSAVWFLSFSLLIGILFFMKSATIGSSPFLLSFSITLFVIMQAYRLALSMTLFFEEEPEESENKTWVLAKALDNMIRHPLTMISLLLINIFCIFLLYFNVIIFFFAIPGAASWLSGIIWMKSSKEENKSEKNKTSTKEEWN